MTIDDLSNSQEAAANAEWMSYNLGTGWQSGHSSGWQYDFTKAQWELPIYLHGKGDMATISACFRVGFITGTAQVQTAILTIDSQDLGRRHGSSRQSRIHHRARVQTLNEARRLRADEELSAYRLTHVLADADDCSWQYTMLGNVWQQMIFTYVAGEAGPVATGTFAVEFDTGTAEMMNVITINTGATEIMSVIKINKAETQYG